MAIMEAAELDDLPSFSQTSRRQRQLAVPIYLRKFNILRPRAFHHAVNLVGELPPYALPFLCSTSNIDSCSLQLDLQYLIEHRQILQQFLARTAKISHIHILVYDEHQLMEHTTGQLTRALFAFIGSLSERQCYDFSIERRMCWPERSPYLPTYPRVERQRKLPQRMSAFASKIERLELCVGLFRTKPLSRLAFSFAHCPSVTRLFLHGSFPFQADDFSDALSRFQLPSLQELTVYGSVRMSNLAGFLIRHPTVEQVSLPCSFAPMSSYLDSRPRLMAVSDATLSTNYIPLFLRAFELPSLTSLTVMAPQCEVMALTSLCFALDIVSTYGSPSITQLEIVFPLSLDDCFTDALLGTIFTSEEQILPRHILAGISDLEITFHDGFQCDASMVSTKFL
jgi:hypothetical protein